MGQDVCRTVTDGAVGAEEEHVVWHVRNGGTRVGFCVVHPQVLETCAAAGAI